MFYIAVSPGDEWSSFPLTGLFPIIIYRGIIYLTSSSIISQYVEPGKDYHISISKRFAQGGNFKIIDPVGTESFKSAALLPAGAVIAFEPFRQFGVYRVLSSVGEPAGIISVNPIPSESMTESLSRKVIIKSIEGLVSDNSIIEFVDNPQNIKQNIKRARIGTELWQIFIIGALLCAIAEMLIERTKKAEIVKQ